LALTEDLTAQDVVLKEGHVAGIHTGTFRRYQAARQAEVFEREARETEQGERKESALPFIRGGVGACLGRKRIHRFSCTAAQAKRAIRFYRS
jgi:hypothetical protein